MTRTVRPVEPPAMRRPRMTTRRWMIAVAVVAILLAAVTLFLLHLNIPNIENDHNIDVPGLP